MVCVCLSVCTPGMTDLLAPLLASMENDVEAFWCFEKLVEGTAYFKPADNPVSVEKQLVSRETVRPMFLGLFPLIFSPSLQNAVQSMHIAKD